MSKHLMLINLAPAQVLFTLQSNRLGSHMLLRLSCLLLVQRSISTPRPPPGPGCTGKGIPIANQSSPSGLGLCPGRLVVHNASCSIERHAPWRGLPLTFHIGSRCHGENDPNGPFFDKRHGVRHLFFQDHIPMQVGGHVATKDFVHWKRLPIAIWNSDWWVRECGNFFLGRWLQRYCYFIGSSRL